MKRLSLVFPLLLALTFTGCLRTVQAPTPLIPGAISQFDANAYKTLVAAHAYAESLSEQAKQGTYKPSPEEKLLVNQFILDLNAADTMYEAYHAGSTTEAQMQAALNVVSADQAKVTTAVGGVK